MELIKKFLRMPLRQKLMIPEALSLAVWYRWQVEHRPFSELSPKIGTLNCETPLDRVPGVAWEVKGVVRAVCDRLPWTTKCLPRALAAKKLLNRRGCKCTLYMGVALGDDGKMNAHAWLRCGRLYVTGGEIASQFTVTTIYGDQPDA